MELFSEIYNCYYQIMRGILQNQTTYSLDDLRLFVGKEGYEESLLHIIPKLTSGEWNLLEKNNDIYISKLSEDFYVPLTNLQKSYIKAVLLDSKIQLFLDTTEIKTLLSLFQNVTPLWYPEDIYYYDRYGDGDSYEDAAYREHFRTILSAISKHQYLNITYKSKQDNILHQQYFPCHIEYSIKNDKFRLFCVNKNAQKPIDVLNLGRILDVKQLEHTEASLPNINDYIQLSYCKEPVRLIIHTHRNALERAMLHFANYKKNTKKIDESTYECLIYYNHNMETELLIEVLSFGPMIEVVGSPRFLKKLKERLKMQKHLLSRK